jgi:caffeoyl-CoA O-methyltransferase
MIPIVAPEIERYAELHTTPASDVLERVADETRRTMTAAQMMVGHLEGRFLEFLVAMTGAKRVLEIGMFTGYSALSMAAALPADGTLITCDVDPKAEEAARRHFESSPHGSKIEIRMGPALRTLAELEGPFDLVFIDADKTNYRNYYEAALPLLADGGIIAVDNVLWSGRVIDDADNTDDTRAIREFNDYVVRDPRVVCVLTTIRDGVLLIRRASS